MPRSHLCVTFHFAPHRSLSPPPSAPCHPQKHFLSTKGGSLAPRVLSQPGANLPASVTPGRKPAALTVHVQGSTAAQQSGKLSGVTWQVYNSSLAETDTDVAELQYTACTTASAQRVARLSPVSTMRDNPLSDNQEDERCPDQLVPTAAASVRRIAADQSQRMTRAASAVAASSACAVNADTVCAAVCKKNRPAKFGSVTDSAPSAAAVESGAPIKAGNGCGPTAAAAGEQPPGHAAKPSSTHSVAPSEEAAVAQDVAPAKRNRGRPPKAAPKAAVAPEQTSMRAATAQPSTRHATATATAVSKVKKRRLPKATANDEQKAEDIAAVKVTNTSQEPDDVAAVKPRRGKPATAAAVEEVPGHTGSAQPSSVHRILPVTVAVPKPKRGRPPKSTTDTEQRSEDSSAGRHGSTSQVAEDAAPVKPRRGQPPKAPAAPDHFPKTAAAAVKPAGDTVHAAAKLVAVPKVEQGQPSKASATRDAAAVKPNSNIHAATDASDVLKARCNCPPKVPAASEQVSCNSAPPAAIPLTVLEPKQRRAPQVAAASEHDSGNTTQPSSSTRIRSTAQPKVAKGGAATITTRGSRPQAPTASQAADSSTRSAKMSCGDQATIAAAAAAGSAEESVPATAPRQDPSVTNSAMPEASGGLRGGSDPLQVLAMAAAAASSGCPPQQSLLQPFTFKATASRYFCYTAPASVAVSATVPLWEYFKPGVRARKSSDSDHWALHTHSLCCGILYTCFVL